MGVLKACCLATVIEQGPAPVQQGAAWRRSGRRGKASIMDVSERLRYRSRTWGTQGGGKLILASHGWVVADRQTEPTAGEPPRPSSRRLGSGPKGTIAPAPTWVRHCYPPDLLGPVSVWTCSVQGKGQGALMLSLSLTLNVESWGTAWPGDDQTLSGLWREKRWFADSDPHYQGAFWLMVLENQS